MNLEKNLLSIRSLFQEGYSVNTSQDFEKINSIYKNINSPHSVVFIEGVSAIFALNSFKETGSFDSWFNFNHFFCLNFAKQTHVGLGWALGELNIFPGDIIKEIKHEWKSKVWNGYGYYNGTIKRRSVLRTNSFPEIIPNDFLPEFIQGFGRSLWYTYKGNIDLITKTIFLFNKQEQIHLWRGLGIAIAFVDGLKKNEWIEMKKHPCIEDLKTGFVLAYPSLKNKETKVILEEMFKENNTFAKN